MLIQTHEQESRTANKTRVETQQSKKRATFDLESEYENAVARPYSVRNHNADLRNVMMTLIDGHVRGTLRSLVRQTVEEYPGLPKPSPDDTTFANAMIHKFPVFATASEITGLSWVMQGKRQEAYYSEHVIAEYMCKLINKRMRKYGVTASIEAKAVVLNMSSKRARVKVSPQLKVTNV